MSEGFNSAEYRKRREEAKRLSAMMFGGTGAAFAPDLIKYFRDDDYKNESFAERVRRADFLSKNWEDVVGQGADNQEFGFKRADPRLRQAFVDRGVLGVEYAAPDVFADAVGKTTDFVPADISQAGAFKPETGQQSILTVTPEAESQRFASPDTGGAGGGASATLWGNDREPQYTYARGNYGVERVDSQNPSAHFSAAELPRASRQEYMTTGKANEMGAGKQGWGRNVGDDLHFSKSFRKAGALTTANDIVTYLRQRGVEVPALYQGDGAGNLEKLTKRLSEVTGKRDYSALQSIASPQPTWGPPTRELGKLPVTTELSFREGDPLRAGVHTFFEYDDPNNSIPSSRSVITGDLPKDVERLGIRQQLIDADVPNAQPRGNFLQRAAGSRLSGLLGSALISPEAAKDFHQGKPVHAVTKLILGGGLGELTGMGFNKAIDAAVKRGVVSAPAIARGFGRVLGPVAAVDALDTATILATGKNPRELAVESGNEAPFIAASMAPLSIAPLGMAGGPIKANVPMTPEREEAFKRSQEGQRRIEEARARGGRWGWGPFTIPDFGFSEGLGIN